LASSRGGHQMTRHKPRTDRFTKAVAAGLALSVCALVAVLWSAVGGMESFF